MSSLFSHLLLMCGMHSGKMYMPPSYSLYGQLLSYDIVFGKSLKQTEQVFENLESL